MVLMDWHCIGDGAEGLAQHQRWCSATGTTPQMVQVDWNCIEDGASELESQSEMVSYGLA